MFSVAPGLRTVTYVNGMKEEGNENIWDEVWSRYLNNTEPTEKYKLLKALTQTRLVWLIHRLGLQLRLFTRLYS